MKSEKEIIDDIISRLKEQPDREYRPGAWEDFKRQNAGTAVKTRHISRWVSAAAALLLLGMGTLYYIKNASVPSVSTTNTIVLENSQPDVKNSAPNEYPTAGKRSAPSIDAKQSITDVMAKVGRNSSAIASANGQTVDEIGNFLNLSLATDAIASVDTELKLPSVLDVHANTRKYTSIGIKQPQIATAIPDNLILAAKTLPTSDLKLQEVEAISQNKQMRFGDKFDLALFVSPQATSQKTNVGAGLTIAYNLTNKLSVRTGASYNSYEVGMLKNPKEATSYEAVVVNNTADISKNMMEMASPQSARMIVPNINAVTSIVQSVDVPLELKYTVGKSIYAVAGVSYSAIIGQERNAHYVDNINTETFSEGMPENENQMKTAVKAVNKTVKSAEKNVETNGFNGFVNFSLGKKVKVNNRFGVSVEPYFKVPIGHYRRADMDYTNGGIRIMTNF